MNYGFSIKPQFVSSWPTHVDNAAPHAYNWFFFHFFF